MMVQAPVLLCTEASCMCMWWGKSAFPNSVYSIGISQFTAQCEAVGNKKNPRTCMLCRLVLDQKCPPPPPPHQYTYGTLTLSTQSCVSMQQLTYWHFIKWLHCDNVLAYTCMTCSVVLCGVVSVLQYKGIYSCV